MFEWLKNGLERFVGRRDQGQPEVAAPRDQRDELRDKRATLQQLVNELDLQVARFGTLHTPAHVTVELRQKRQELADLDAEIARLDGGGGLNVKQSRSDQIAHLEAIRAELRQTMFDLELQEARFGKHNTPAHVSAELRDKRQRLADLEVEIARLGLHPEQ